MQAPHLDKGQWCPQESEKHLGCGTITAIPAQPFPLRMLLVPVVEPTSLGSTTTLTTTDYSKIGMPRQIKIFQFLPKIKIKKSQIEKVKVVLAIPTQPYYIITSLKNEQETVLQGMVQCTFQIPFLEIKLYLGQLFYTVKLQTQLKGGNI